ncbi:aminoacylase-1 [Halyomorpha halys]|uniref:aminoacylase-1 n=1 Tax=Halyomorpha halys TaxID=286706 RepID=UPI0006D51746|nr:aminoacylase-1-like [Halyomorpha halys]
MDRRDCAIVNFRNYLKIKSVHPEPDYDGCVNFLKKVADEYGFQTTVFRLDDKRPVLIISVEGSQPDLPSILLNSHMDVVPVFEEEWKYDPFGAEMDSNGDIYARGAQDMKCVTIAQLEALKNIKSSGVGMKRTVHMTILPDEEIGSDLGMAKFVHTETFKNLNVGFDIDEGSIMDNDDYIIFNNERCKWSIRIHCPGQSGHGSLLWDNTAGEKLRVVIDHFMDFRSKEALKQKKHTYFLGDVTTVNLTSLQGGIQNNILPPEIVVGFDLRIAADVDHKEIENWINDVCKKAGEGVYPEYIQKDPQVPVTVLEGNVYWHAMDTTFKNLGMKYIRLNCFAASDARFVRGVGIPAIGFSPFNNSSVRLHDHNEYLNKDIFLKGISIYEKLIPNVANA